MKTTHRFRIFRDKRGDWRWNLTARNGKIVAESGEGYRRKTTLRRTLDRIGLAFAGGAIGCLLLLSTGCASSAQRMATLITAAGKDNATISASVTTIYGTVKFVRTNPMTNSTVTVSPDGTVTVNTR